jgi:hypothetical protein
LATEIELMLKQSIEKSIKYDKFAIFKLLFPLLIHCY